MDPANLKLLKRFFIFGIYTLLIRLEPKDGVKATANATFCSLSNRMANRIRECEQNMDVTSDEDVPLVQRCDVHRRAFLPASVDEVTIDCLSV